MKHALLASLLALYLPASASALAVDDDLIAVAAMPLAVAAVTDIPEVPQNDLFDVIRTMNRALVPAPQFIEVVRYVPVALLDTNQPFTTYVDSQYSRGLTGQALAVAMEDRIETYDGADIDVVRAPRAVVVDDNFYPEVVVTRFQPVRYDPLSLVAMPLAVAAVAELTDIPALELASFVSLLNQARVPPAQFVEVVRYSPVALIDTRPEFLTFVTTQVSDGTRGMFLARSLADRIESYGVDQINVVEPPRIVYTETHSFVPAAVVQQVAAARTHPHGGPPGQLKKELGLQTGAEVVHGSRPGSTLRGVEQNAGASVKRRSVDTPRASRAAASVRAERAPKEHKTVKPARENRRVIERHTPRVKTTVERQKPARTSPLKAHGGGNAQRVDTPKLRGGGKPAAAPMQKPANAGGGAVKPAQNKGNGKGKG